MAVLETSFFSQKTGAFPFGLFLAVKRFGHLIGRELDEFQRADNDEVLT